MRRRYDRILATLCTVGMMTTLVSTGALADVQFLDPLTDEPITLDLKPDQEITAAVEEFHETGENPYVGDEQAIAAGEDLYKRLCQACHMPDGSGRIGPSLVDEQHKYERTGTQKGMFEIVYVGGAGAMQAFGRRITQDEILEVLAYVETLGEQ